MGTTKLIGNCGEIGNGAVVAAAGDKFEIAELALAELRNRRDAIDGFLSAYERLKGVSQELRNNDWTVTYTNPFDGLGDINGNPIRSHSGNGRATVRKGSDRLKPAGKASLGDAMRKILANGKPKSIDQIVEALPSAGHASRSPNLRIMVTGKLIRKPFKRVSRGVYCLPTKGEK